MRLFELFVGAHMVEDSWWNYVTVAKNYCHRGRKRVVFIGGLRVENWTVTTFSHNVKFPLGCPYLT